MVYIPVGARLAPCFFLHTSMEAIVLYPPPNMGHLISMVELAQLILHHHHPSNSHFSIHILITSPPVNLGSASSYIASVSATTPSIIFHHLPDPSPPLQPASFPSVEALVFEHINLTNPQVHTALLSISLSSSIRAFVIDCFCTPALDVGTSLQIPTYHFFTSGASCLALFLYLPTLHKNTTKSFKDLNTHLQVPGLPPIPSSHMPEPTLDRTKEQYSWFLHSATHLPKSAGIIVNTFNSLEPYALKAVSDGICVQDGHTPPIFCVGPVIKSNDQSAGGQAECLQWLDSQPRGKVVFLSFGSLGTFSKEQLKEIAVGLERSGQRFLWVVRSPPMKEQIQQLPSQSDEPDLDSLLPESFLAHTRDKGLVVKQWAPQVEVLSHDAVGSFVTHCGWNSVLEAVYAGVPMVAWPLYAEQRFNKTLLVEQLKLALPMNESAGGLVSAAEVERRVRAIMDSEEGKLVRERVLAKRQEAMAATSELGSSRVALAEFVKSAKR